MSKRRIKKVAVIGSGIMGVHPRNNPVRVAIAAYPWGAYFGGDGVTRGIKAKISSYTRMNVNSFMTKAKICGNYANSVLAKLEVTALGFDETHSRHSTVTLLARFRGWSTLQPRSTVP